MTVGLAVVVVVEASASKVYPMVTPASASTLSVSMVRREEGLLKGLGGLLFGSMQGLQGYFCAPYYYYQFDFGVRRDES